MVANKKKINKMSTNEKIQAVQACLLRKDTQSAYFLKLNTALPTCYRVS
jgi:hypothetical protein